MTAILIDVVVIAVALYFAYRSWCTVSQLTTSVQNLEKQLRTVVEIEKKDVGTQTQTQTQTQAQTQAVPVPTTPAKAPAKAKTVPVAQPVSKKVQFAVLKKPSAFIRRPPAPAPVMTIEQVGEGEEGEEGEEEGEGEEEEGTSSSDGGTHTTFGIVDLTQEVSQ